MHQQNPVDVPPESRGTTRIRRTPTESCFHLQRGFVQSNLNTMEPQSDIKSGISDISSLISDISKYL